MKPLISLLLICVGVCYIGCSAIETIEEIPTDGENPIDDEPPMPEEEAFYFPAMNSEDWETISMEELGWNEDAEQPLYDLLLAKGTKVFIILKDGRIVVEKYFNGGGVLSTYPWYSVGKTLTAFTVGLAQQDGFLTIEDGSSNYLGAGWTSLTTEKENEIKVEHNLTMTTGLDYNVSNQNCTDPECLTPLNDPGSFWYYHNAAYTLVQSIVEGAINDNFNTYFNSSLRNTIGMDGTWLNIGYTNIFYSTGRSMARFGLLNLNEGSWGDIQILSDTSYFDKMTNTSQDYNKAYGYFWWLNGKDSFRVPSSELEFSGKLIPNAPDDLIAGLGKNDQKLYVVPSEGLVIVRMGESTGETVAGPSSFDNLLWEKISLLIN